MKTRRWPVVAGVIAVAGIVALVALFAGGGDDQPVSTDATTTPTITTTTTTATTTTTERVTTTTTATTTTTERVTTTIARTAADDLADFFAAAAELDGQLKAAAAAINAGMTETEMVVDQATVDLVQATRAQIDEVNASIPAGMEPDLLRATLPVFSDLVSRSYAMMAWDWPRSPGYETVTLIESNVLSCLSNGSEAAARYPADLAALRTLAQSSPPVAVAAPDSRAAEDLAVHLENVENGNSCCEGCGGYIATELADVRFEDNPTVDPQTGDRTDGYLGPHGIPFQTDYEAGVGWTVEIFVG
jgi:hypothetical protein